MPGAMRRVRGHEHREATSLNQKIDLEQLCAEKGLRITEQRRVIAKVLSDSDDHPDVELLHQRA